MASLKRIVKKLQRKSSKSHVMFLGFVVILFFGVAMALRYYAFEPLRLNDGTMYPKFHEHEIVWMCKLPLCLEKLNVNDYVWAELRNEESMIRKIVGMPGDKISISNRGRFKSKRTSFRWKEENIFIESRSFHIPQKGDTLWHNKLNDIEEDYFLSILSDQGEDFYIQTSLWQGEKEMPLEKIGASKLGNRQVSLHEVNTLPWQDRYLLELQIFRRESGTQPYKIKRNFYRASDSTAIEYVVAKEDYYFLACEQGAHCPDSRELGYFPKSRILGIYKASSKKATKNTRNFLLTTQSTRNFLFKKLKFNEQTLKPAEH